MESRARDNQIDVMKGIVVALMVFGIHPFLTVCDIGSIYSYGSFFDIWIFVGTARMQNRAKRLSDIY